MQIIDYFKVEEKERWNKKLQTQESDWNAIKYLVYLLEDEKRLDDYFGKYRKLFLMIDNDEIIALLTLSDIDCIIDSNMYPWIGFVYTYPKYRGNRYSEKIINFAEDKAKEDGFDKVYISTGEDGLYEKYGYKYMETRIDRWDDEAKMYVKNI